MNSRIKFVIGSLLGAYTIRRLGRVVDRGLCVATGVEVSYRRVTLRGFEGRCEDVTIGPSPRHP
jgi:hypothetical protein